jgi:hypothetical protein
MTIGTEQWDKQEESMSGYISPFKMMGRRGDTLGQLGALGSAIAPFAGPAGMLLSMGGALLDDTDEKKLKLERERLELDKRAQTENENQFDLGLSNKRSEFGRSAAFQGLQALADGRMESQKSLKSRAFRNALYQVAGGAA